MSKRRSVWAVEWFHKPSKSWLPVTSSVSIKVSRAQLKCNRDSSKGERFRSVRYDASR